MGGRLVDRAGPRAVLRVCLFGAAVGLALAGLADRWAFMLAALAFVALFTFPPPSRSTGCCLPLAPAGIFE